MLLKEFIECLKAYDKSKVEDKKEFKLNIIMYDIINGVGEEEEILLSGDLLAYVYWDDRKVYENLEISVIKPFNDEFCIYLRGDENV